MVTKDTGNRRHRHINALHWKQVSSQAFRGQWLVCFMCLDLDHKIQFLVS